MHPFVGEPFNEEEQAAYEEVRETVNEHLDDPLIDRLHLSLLLALDAIKGLARHAAVLESHLATHHEVINDQGKRIEFLEQMLLKEES